MLVWLRSRSEIESRLVALAPKDEAARALLASQVNAPGFCSGCERSVSFRVTHEPPEEMDGWRNLLEGMICDCGLNGRMRSALVAWQNLRKTENFRTSLIFEQVTPIYRLMSGLDPALTGCEYLGADKVAGETYPWGGQDVRHESIEALSCSDNSLDLLMHFDVLEHVPDLALALGECWRVLRPGGSMLFTLPFYPGLEKHRVRAVMSDGELQHLEAPAYHGNPVGDGALVFIHPGWQLLDDLGRAGFAVSAALVFDPGQGIVSNNCPFADGVSWPLVFRAVKA
jgi:SAM-dependent methyltransferase